MSDPSDVWGTHRAATDQPWDEPTLIPELEAPNPSSSRSPTSISPDGCQLVLAYSVGAVGEIAIASKPAP